MKITRETDYAIRCVCYLADHEKKVSMIDTISRECRVPPTFLAKILQKLGKAGLVKSFRGLKGGFSLAKPPEEINLYDVILTVQGPIVFSDCAVKETTCGLSSKCTVHPVWVKLRQMVQTTLRKATLKRLMYKGIDPDD